MAEKDKAMTNAEENKERQETPLLTVSKEELESMVQAMVQKQTAVSMESSGETIPDDRKAVEAREETWLNEKVPYLLFRDGREYKDDQFVAVGGIRAQIKRGQTVMIPRKLALALDEADAQRNASNDRSAEISRQFMDAMSV